MEKKIADILKNSPEGMSILEVAEKVKLNRNSTARYLDVLKNRGIVRERHVGPAKLYFYEDILPFEERVSLYEKAMNSASCGITIAENKGDLPLIYVNDAFCKMTGYSRSEIIGKNCRFLQADQRDQKALLTLKKALRDGTECTVQLRNFRKDGSEFLNELHIAPIKDGSGNITHFVGVQTIR
jgi:PAS domain S-box-containing protein